MTALPLEDSRDATVTGDARGEATRKRILDAAQKLFSEHGTNGVSLRAITSEAGANSAAANYHFGSKSGLLEAVFARHAAGIAQEREAMLAQCRAEPGRPPMLEQIVRAFLEPGMRGEHGGTSFARFRGRMLAENSEQTRELYVRYFNGSTGQFLDALRKVLPDLSETDLFWRVHVMLGTMVYTLANTGRIQALSNGACDPSDLDDALDHLVPMIAHLFRGPATPTGTSDAARTLNPIQA
ncbi:MAG: TetR family transcriptional regulator [Alphaproteobacteria bacterium]|nr:TetR family transcriptional regulator [Alphaproteobacteria bacterium]